MPVLLRVGSCLLLAATVGCADSAGPSEITDPALAREVVTLFDHTCALSGDRTAYCWGRNDFGQVGDGTWGNSRLQPVPVAKSLNFKTITVGARHTCALTDEGVAWCWGWNVEGELGDGTLTTQRDEPGPVVGAPGFESLQAGAWWTCGLTSAGEAYCWGSNLYSTLGDGTSEDRAVPTAVSTSRRFTSLALGPGSHTCGIASDPPGTAWCWGSNEYGQLGNEEGGYAQTPVAAQPAHTFVSLSVGGAHTCGVTTRGTLLCWGANDFGQLGDGSTSSGWEAREVAIPSGHLAQVSLSEAYSCGLTDAGEAYCWGGSAAGPYGLHSVFGPTPVRTAPNLRFSALGAGWDHICGLTEAGLIYCWGENSHGQLGDGSGTMGSTTPVLVRW